MAHVRQPNHTFQHVANGISDTFLQAILPPDFRKRREWRIHFPPLPQLHWDLEFCYMRLARPDGLTADEEAAVRLDAPADAGGVRRVFRFQP